MDQANSPQYHNNLSKAEIEKLLANCEKEQLHLSGAIQPHGYLLHVNFQEKKILHASNNIHELLGITADKLLQRYLDLDLSDLFYKLSCIKLKEDENKKVFLDAFSTENSSYDILTFKSGTGQVFEFSDKQQSANPQPRTTQMISLPITSAGLISSQSNTVQVAYKIIERVQILTGFERVLVYRFADDWSGEVIAETLAPHSSQRSFLGLCFPASDIPKIARDLYLHNPFRLIPNADAIPIPIVSAADRKDSLDLTYSDLRSVSPLHIQYLKNMNVAASFSLSISIMGHLWGLIACHNPTPLHLSVQRQMLCANEAQNLATLISWQETQRKMKFLDQVDLALHEIFDIKVKCRSLPQTIHDSANTLLRLTNATGAALIVDNQCTLIGQTPTEEEVLNLASHLFNNKNGGSDIIQTDSISQNYPDGENFKSCASGALGTRAKGAKDRKIKFIWFRPEIIQTIHWAGNPNKEQNVNINKADFTSASVLCPRHSFEVWKETKKAKSLPWTKLDILAAQKFRIFILHFSTLLQ